MWAAVYSGAATRPLDQSQQKKPAATAGFSVARQALGQRAIVIDGVTLEFVVAHVRDEVLRLLVRRRRSSDTTIIARRTGRPRCRPRSARCRTTCKSVTGPVTPNTLRSTAG